LRTNLHLFREAQESKPSPAAARKARSFGS
jgi:hypothetical protein